MHWRLAVDMRALALPTTEDVVTTKLIPRLAWTAPRSFSRAARRSQGVPIGVQQLRVKVLTSLQMGPILDARADKQVVFMQEACASLSPGHGLSAEDMLPIYRSLWALPWDNKKKEVYWRLALDALPTAARLHLQGEPCNCGVMMPDRAHHFWDCPVAMAVRGEIERALNSAGGQYNLQRHHLWLCRLPSRPDLHKGVWMVVCMAALLAMNTGRKCLTKWRLEGGQGATGGGTRRPPALSRRIAAASRVATAAFWDQVQDFLSLGLAPAPWVADIPVGHPFIQLHTTAGGSRALQLNKVG